MRKIRKAFADELSEQIWECLNQLNQTGDYRYLVSAHQLSGIVTDEINRQQAEFQQLKRDRKRLVYYGLGKATLDMVKLENERRGTPGYINFPFLGDAPIDAFCDKNYSNYPDIFLNKKVISPQELYESENTIVIIGAPSFYEEIKLELTAHGISEENIRRYVYPNTICYEEKQYFDDFFEAADESTVIDGGCFRCDTIERFITWNAGKGYKKIISFEPDKKNFAICTEIKEQMGWKNVEIMNAGVAKESETRSFIENGNDTSMFDDRGDVQVELKSIDSVVDGDRVSFIKLDVEGYELEALIGAKETILKYHPRMAVSLYHKKEDIWKIPEYLLELHQDYKFYLRIYSNAYLEIVLYVL